MSHEKYWPLIMKIHEALHAQLENRAVIPETPPPLKEKDISSGSPSISEKAAEIRFFIRANINDKEHKHLSKTAKNALLMLLDGRFLVRVPDKELVEWYENWVETVK